MEYRLMKQEDLTKEGEKFIYCFCGNPEDYEIITNNYLHIYNFMGNLTMDKIAGKSLIYKIIKAYKYVIKNKSEIASTLEYLDSINCKLVITCYDDFDISPILYTIINKLIDNKCTCILENDMIKENSIKVMKKLYGYLYFKFVYKNFYNNGEY